MHSRSPTHCSGPADQGSGLDGFLVTGRRVPAALLESFPMLQTDSRPDAGQTIPVRHTVEPLLPFSDRHRAEVNIDTTFLRRCIASLERAVQEIGRLGDSEEVLYEIYRAACVKEFELVLEQSGKFLRKRLAAYFASNRQAERLNFRDLFRHAARHDLIDTDAVERWLHYRDNHNETAHDYGEDFAETTLKLLPAFVEDAKSLANIIEQSEDG